MKEYAEFQAVLEAKQRIKDFVYRTPLIRAHAMDQLMGGAEVYLKPECLQITGSFKLRGAANKILSLTPEQRKNGVITTSSGNHGQGVAYAARECGVPAVVCMPTVASPYKVERVRALGAEAVVIGTFNDETEVTAHVIEQERGMAYIHAYNDKYVLAGQGTMGLEILEDLPDVDLIVTPIGGGGMIAGTSLAAKSMSKKVKVYGCEPVFVPRFGESRRQGKPVMLTPEHTTLADGIRTRVARPLNFNMIERYVDELVALKDEDIASAMKIALANTKLTLEPTSAIVFAAGLTGLLPLKKGMKVCFVVSGGNAGAETLREYL